MGIFDLYSKRQKRLKGEILDVFVYNDIPQKLRVQIVHIIRDAIGVDTTYEYLSEASYHHIHKVLCKEYGVFYLGKVHTRTCVEQVLNFFLEERDVEKILDGVEVSFKYIDDHIRWNYNRHINNTSSSILPDDAIDELNQRFKENGIGFQFEGGEIIRIDSTVIHTEITKPVIYLLRNNKFLGANEEYLKAHEHYRHGRNKECLTECLKAFESTMKVICKEKSWPFDLSDPAKKLIQICFNNGLVPTYTQNQFTSLQNLIESGIPPIRNKLSGHGQGQNPINVSDELTRYGLNLTGTNIIFLIEQSGIK